MVFFFQSKGGLRQGNPLFLCLFIIATEFLSRGLDRICTQYLSMRYCSATPISVSHLSFADNIIIFLNESRSSLWWVIKFLHHYKAVSEQSINQAKSCFYIGTFASASQQAIVHSITDF